MKTMKALSMLAAISMLACTAGCGSSNKIDLDYLRYILEPRFRDLKKGREGENGENEYTSLPPFMIKTIKIALPVDEKGNPDIVAQHDMAQRYLALEQYKKEISERLKALINQRIEI